MTICFRTKEGDGHIFLLKTATLIDSEKWVPQVRKVTDEGEETQEEKLDVVNGTFVKLNTIRQPNESAIPIDEPSEGSIQAAMTGIIADGFEHSPFLTAVLTPLDKDDLKRRIAFHEFLHSRRLQLWFPNSWSIVNFQDKDKSSTMIGHIAIQQPTGPNYMSPSLWTLLRMGFLKIPFYFGIAVTRRFLEVVDVFTEIQKEVLESNSSMISDGKMFIIEAFVVTPTRQGQGIGGQVFDRILEEYVDNLNDKSGSLPCFLMTQEKENVAMYQKRGFEILDNRKVTLTKACRGKTPEPEDTFENWVMLRPAKK